MIDPAINMTQFWINLSKAQKVEIANLAIEDCIASPISSYESAYDEGYDDGSREKYNNIKQAPNEFTEICRFIIDEDNEVVTILLERMAYELGWNESFDCAINLHRNSKRELGQ